MEKQTTILFIISVLVLAGAVYFFVLPEETGETVREERGTETMPESEKGEEVPEEVPEEAPLEVAELTEDEIEIKEFKTDRETYGSYEKIQLSIRILSKKDVEGAEIKITGIQPYQRVYIDESKIVNLAEGENALHFEAQTPYCTSGCGGVYPGPYDIHANIFIDGNLIKSAKTVINLVNR